MEYSIVLGRRQRVGWGRRSDQASFGLLEKVAAHGASCYRVLAGHDLED
jgi:hypothetical protein